ncbi:MAG TPA: PhnD/SsuA/transferrin family substrate-binding protein [Acidiferrobacterales bacterium]|nr:PhnD/SsuA/transferrin family substrate-binding protein [Acidiferrobacterales bacterium]
MKATRRFVLLVAALCAVVRIGMAAPAFAQGSLQFGLLPSRSTPETIRNYSPLKAYLERALKREIILCTAPDFREYIRRTRAGEYDFLCTSAPMARLAQQEAGFKPLVRVRDDFYGVLLVATAAPYKKTADLRGKMVATPDALATASVLGQKLFIDAGLQPGRDITLRPSPSSTSAALAVIYGTADAALTARLRMALLNFNKNKEESSQFFQSTGYTPVTEEDMQSLTPLLKMLNQRLAQEQP